MKITYNIKPITTPGISQITSSGPSINRHGHLVCSYFSATENIHKAFMYDGRDIITIRTGSGVSSGAVCVNDNGFVVGYAILKTIEGKTHHKAFIFNENRIQLISIDNYTHCIAYSVNNKLQVLIQVNNEKSFLYYSGDYHLIGTLGGEMSRAFSINDNGYIVGNSRNKEGLVRAFLYNREKTHNLGVLYSKSDNVSSAFDINNRNEIVGASGKLSGGIRAFIYKNHEMHELSSINQYHSRALSINNSGDIIGQAYKNEKQLSQSRALLWRGSDVIDLNDTIVDPDWTLNKATCINDAGQIAGWGYWRGVQTIFLMTPSTAA